MPFSPVNTRTPDQSVVLVEVPLWWTSDAAPVEHRVARSRVAVDHSAVCDSRTSAQGAEVLSRLRPVKRGNLPLDSESASSVRSRGPLLLHRTLGTTSARSSISMRLRNACRA